MKHDGRFVARVALFTALAYVSALISVYIPNVSLIYIVVFAAGAVFGLSGGIIVGGLGMLLWSMFNPYGMTALPVTVAQVAGMMIVGLLGAVARTSEIMTRTTGWGFFVFVLFGLVSGLLFQLVVSTAYAWLYGPFWPALISNMGFALLTVVSNGIIFPLCYPLLVKLAAREKRF
jgi:uncharacterized membrane protein